MIHISDSVQTNTVTLAELGTSKALVLNLTEQRELLEALARIHGFSLVDHVERKSLLELVEEVDHPERLPEPNIHLVRSRCGWRKTAEALASAVAGALDLNPQEA